MTRVNNLPALDGAGARSSGAEPEPCFCQSQKRYAGECLRWNECVEAEQGREPHNDDGRPVGPFGDMFIDAHSEFVPSCTCEYKNPGTNPGCPACGLEEFRQ